MPTIAAVTTIDLPHRALQSEVKEYAQSLFIEDFPQVKRLISIFDSTEIIHRNLAKPLASYGDLHTFEDNNKEYIRLSLEYSIQAIEAAVLAAGISKEAITDIIFLSSTGMATPSLDALIVNQMRLSENINRMSIFGLGCAGGVSGMAKANAIATANPDAVVLLVTVELCSLTFLRHDYTKSNFVASSLFSDGVAATLVMGDNHASRENKIEVLSSQSKLYFDSLDVMGWEFLETGFKVLFSQDIPTIILTNIYADVMTFLSKNGLEMSDIKNFIFHPGGKKVLSAYEQAMGVEGDFLKNTRETMNHYGNMSSTTVIYVLEKFLREGFEPGYGLMVAMGPGFSSEMVLLDMHKN